MDNLHLLPASLQELAIGDTPLPTSPENGYGSVDPDIVEPLGRPVKPGRIITGSPSSPTGIDSNLASSVRRTTA
jgi:hypothetical protein